MKNFLFYKLLFIFFYITSINCINYDLTIIGSANFNDGLGRISIGLIDHLNNDLKINYINSRNEINKKELSRELISILEKKNNRLGKIILFTDGLYNDAVLKNLNVEKKTRKIRIAYSMFESSRISQKWVSKLNNYFDAIIVPDDYLVDVYVNSGVKIPIFVLPLGLYLDEFLNYKKKPKNNNKFIFGCLANFDSRKNQSLLIRAFVEEFGNNENVILKINGRSFDNTFLKNYVLQLKQQNIILTKENLPWKKYIEFMSELDCYVCLSKGEGFSIPPREALAMKIPCILTDNTAQSTICKTGFVKSIVCDILEKAKFPSDLFDKSEDLGLFFNCKLSDVKKALREVYENYIEYKIKARKAQQWVRQYQWQNLKNKYISIFRPKKIILGKQNIINEDYIITNSKDLYNKYNIAFKS